MIKAVVLFVLFIRSRNERRSSVNGTEAVIAETLFLEIDNGAVTYAEVVEVIRIRNKWKVAL